MKNRPPKITITISGSTASGKTTLGHLFGRWLLNLGHKVTFHDARDGAKTPDQRLGQAFTDPRRIQLKVVEQLPHNERTCVHCGCTDSRACRGGCTWLETHAATPTGVCSACATIETFPEGTVIFRHGKPRTALLRRQ